MQARDSHSAGRSEAAARLRGGTFTLMVLDVPATGDPLAGLESKLNQAPSFFENAPLVLDLIDLPEDDGFDLFDLVARIQELGMVPVGVQNAGERHSRQALAAGLCPFPVWRSGRQRPSRDEPPKAPARAAPAEPAPQQAAQPQQAAAPARQPEPAPEPEREDSPALLVTQPVRSGQRVYARGKDLVAAAPVSAGAELIADGHVHVYGPLRGRALAGVGGDESARIFCQSLDAELVGVGGAYRVREDIDEALIGKAAQIYLEHGELVIAPLVRALR